MGKIGKNPPPIREKLLDAVARSFDRHKSLSGLPIKKISKYTGIGVKALDRLLYKERPITMQEFLKLCDKTALGVDFGDDLLRPFGFTLRRAEEDDAAFDPMKALIAIEEIVVMFKKGNRQ